MTVCEEEIEEAIALLAKMDVNAEPGGAAGFAGLAKLMGNGNVLKGRRAVVIVTGSNGR